MSNIDEVIKRIIALRPELTHEAVQLMIQEEKSRAAGLLTDEAAAHIVASLLSQPSVQRTGARTSIDRLTAGLGDVSLTGRVINVSRPVEFSRRDGRTGKLVRMIMGDKTGAIAVLLWDDKADLIIAGKVGPGSLVRILHGYTRERQGAVELNVGQRGEIYLEPLDSVSASIPPLDDFFSPASEIHQGRHVNVAGVVVERLPASEFNRRDGQKGRVMRMRLRDTGGGEATVVIWDQKVDELGSLEPGTRIQLADADARRGNDGRLEVHVSSSTSVKVVETGLQVDRIQTETKIHAIRPGMRGINLVARVAGVNDVRTFQRQGDQEGRVASVLLSDQTGSIRLALWDASSELSKALRLGDQVRVIGAYARQRGMSTELSLASDGEVTPISEKGPAEESLPKPSAIRDLQEGMSVTVEGRVVESPYTREVTTRRGDTARVASFVVDDTTGEARISVWRELVDVASSLELGSQVRVENCQVRAPYRGRTEISSGPFTRIILQNSSGPTVTKLTD